ncbi:MAG TPA: chalcone isomerase, partial [Flavobacterium sp.]|nr:chalcone isomerase [Flavobacterium sp.]
MKNQFLTMLFVGLSTFISNAQPVLAGIRLEEKIVVEGKNLVLNGAGIREKYFMDLYVGSLYVTKKSSNDQELINSKDATAIKLNIISGMITSKKMISAVNEGFENATNKNTAPLKAKIDKFKGFFKDEIVKGDVFTIAFDGNEVHVFKNGTKKGSIDGYDFKKVLF